MPKLALIVGGQSEDERAFAAQFDIDAAGSEKVRGEARPARLALSAKGDQRLLARFGFAARGEHAGSRMTCPSAGLAAIEHRDRRAAGKPPGDAKPNNAGADDRNARPIV